MTNTILNTFLNTGQKAEQATTEATGQPTRKKYQILALNGTEADFTCINRLCGKQQKTAGRRTTPETGQCSQADSKPSHKGKDWQI